MRFHGREDVPAGLRADSFALRPLTIADTPGDHEAVMESRAELRPWEQTGWPADDLTLEEDRADVEGLERRHRDGDAFTYTVTEGDGGGCLGCVYVMPPDARFLQAARITPIGPGRWEECGAAVYFWIRTSRLAEGLDRALVDGLRPWLTEEWGLPEHVLVTSESAVQQVDLLRGAGLRIRFRIEEPGKPAPYLAFG